MVRKFLIATIVTITLFSCSVDDGNSNFSIKTLPIKTAEVPSEFIFGQTYTLKVVYDIPTSCHSFYGLFYRHEGFSRVVAINSLVNNDLTSCDENPIEREYTFEVRALQNEDYTFKFWKGKDNSGNDIFEEVVVPVN